MPITIFTDNRMEKLAEILGNKLCAELPGKGIFHQPQVIVPNRGIARFLTLRFAEQQRVIMGMQFPYLMTFLLRNVGRVAGDVQEQGDEAHELFNWDALINKESLAMRIWAVLPELLDKEDFGKLKKYVSAENTALRRWQLAEKLAALFDCYILYRPDWILLWENKEELKGLFEKARSVEAWQRTLWQAVRQDWPAGADGKVVHFAHVYQKICSGEWKLDFKDPIRLFGFSAFPAPILKCLEKLDVEVEIYTVSPCGEYWGDVKKEKAELEELIDLWESVRLNGVPQEQEKLFFESQEQLFFQNNPLLGSFATQGRKFFVRSLEWEQQPLFDDLKEPVTLLQKVQDALCHNRKLPEGEVQYSGEPDTSIQIHSCYSEFREVEALHDYLLGCFAKDKGLTFNDVIIMSPTPERYAPFLEAVFHNPAHGSNMLRVACSEQASAEKLSALKNFLKVLQTRQGRFEAAGVMELLSVPEIRKNFNIPEEDLDFIRQAVCDAGICWGWNGDERKKFFAEEAEIDFDKTTWRQGLDRMLLGYAEMAETEFEKLYGIDNFCRKGELLGNFCRFAELLHDTVCWIREKETAPVPLQDWCDFLLERAALFFGSESPLCSLLRPQLANLRRNARNALCDLGFESDVIFAILQRMLDDIPETSRDFLRGRITFCGLRPMRSIPGRIVCLLGMNHDTFPRSGVKESYDLMHELPRRDDPVKLDDERQLFLEILLSARENLYISYYGRGIRDNKEYAASSCVEELRNYLAEAFGKGSWYDMQEPLQAFDASLFASGNPVQSHSQVLCRCAEKLRESANEKEVSASSNFQLTAVGGEIPEEFYSVSLEELCSFFKNTVEYFMKKRLGAVPFEAREIELPEVEPLAFEHMSYNEWNEVYNKALTDDDGEWEKEFVDRMQSNGKIPQIRDAAAQCTLLKDCKSICEKQKKFSGDEIRYEACTVKIGNFTLHLPAMNFRNDVQIFPLFYSWEGQAYRFMLYHVAANLLCSGIETIVVSQNSIYHITGFENCDAAEEKMKDILSLYEKGLREPLLFFKKSSLAAYKVFRNEAATAVKGKWNAYQFPERNDYKKFYDCDLPDPDAVWDNAQKIFCEFQVEETEKGKSK